MTEATVTGGLIRYMDGRSDEIAPVFDNGGSFLDGLSEEKAKRILSDRERARADACDTQTAYVDRDGHIISSRRFLELQDPYPELRKAIIEMVPLIESKRNDIAEMIRDLPGEVKWKQGETYEICKDNRKELFCLQLDSRFEDMLVPAYKKALGAEKAAVYPSALFLCVKLVLLNHWVPFLSVRSVLKYCTDLFHQA